MSSLTNILKALGYPCLHFMAGDPPNAHAAAFLASLPYGCKALPGLPMCQHHVHGSLLAYPLHQASAKPPSVNNHPLQSLASKESSPTPYSYRHFKSGK